MENTAHTRPTMCTYQLCGRAVRENFCLEVMVHERTEGLPTAATNRRPTERSHEPKAASPIRQDLACRAGVILASECSVIS